MEKNTKILLGVGAVIAAYLILKPKKIIAQEVVINPIGSGADIKELETLENYIQPLESIKINTTDQIICSEGSSYSYGGFCRDSEGNIRPQIQNPNYNENDAIKLKLEMEEIIRNHSRLKGDPIAMMICGDGSLGYNCY